MKNLLFLILAICFFVTNAQVPEGFNYQAVVRNATGEIISNTNVSLRISILQESESGSTVYSEVHNATTNGFGLVNLVVGNGDVVEGVFSPGGWGINKHFIKVEIDPKGGNSFTHMGTSQLRSVPYAFHAQTVEQDSIEDADADPTNELQILSKEGNIISLTDGSSVTDSVIDADADPTNELQSISISGTELTLSDGGGTVALPSSGGGDNWGTQVAQTDETLKGDGTTLNPLGVKQSELLPEWANLQGVPAGFADDVDNVNDADANSNNEIQTLSIDGTDLSLSKGGGTVSLPSSDGDITTVNAGIGLTGGGSSGDITLDVEVPLHLVSSHMNVAAIKSTNSSSGTEATLGSTSAVYAKNGTSTDGFLATPSYGVTGSYDLPYSQDNIGRLGSEDYGAYGTYALKNYGILGTSTEGVIGEHKSSGNYGKLGTDNEGVYGYNPSGGYGVYGYNNTAGYGLYGWNNSGGVGVRAYSPHYAGYFDGNVHVAGVFSKTSGSFRIDHPLDPANKYLQHSFVESPDMMNIYNGNIELDNKGEETILMPEWFEALNMEFRYQLTCIGGFANVYISEELENNQFKIAGGTAGLKVSWQVTGVRQDAFANENRIEVEVDKEGDEAGKYLHPEAFGLSEEMGVDYEERQSMGQAYNNKNKQ